ENQITGRRPPVESVNRPSIIRRPWRPPGDHPSTGPGCQPRDRHAAKPKQGAAPDATPSAPPKQRIKPLSAWSPRGHQAVTSGSIMPPDHLTYAQIAERPTAPPEAARAIVKRHRLPRSRSNDGKTLAAIDLKEIRHKPLPARSPRGHRSVTTVVATLKARIATLEAELVAEQQRSAGHRADFERERADQLVTTQDP